MGATRQIAISENELKEIKQVITSMAATLTELKETGLARNKIYTNKQLMQSLGIGEKLIKKYRDDGILSFHKVGDKFWYTEEDVQEFLAQAYVHGNAIK